MKHPFAPPYASNLARARGTTLLYLGGIVAVCMILLFGLADQTIAHTHRMANVAYRVRAEWLLRGGHSVLVARCNSSAETMQCEIPFQTGNLTCRSEVTAGGLAFFATGKVPRDFPRLTLAACWVTSR